MKTSERLWPVAVDGVRGWPMPDCAGDPCPLKPVGPIGWRPWAVWQAASDWYVGFYTCDRGHAWTCGHGVVAGAKDMPDLREIRISPQRTIPTDDQLAPMGLDPVDLHLRLVEWSDR